MPTLGFVHPDGTVTDMRGTQPADAAEPTLLAERAASYAEMTRTKPADCSIVEFEADPELFMATADAWPFAIERGRLVSHPVLYPERKRREARAKLLAQRNKRAALVAMGAEEGVNVSREVAEVDAELSATRARLRDLGETVRESGNRSGRP